GAGARAPSGSAVSASARPALQRYTWGNPVGSATNQSSPDGVHTGSAMLPRVSTSTAPAAGESTGQRTRAQRPPALRLPATHRPSGESPTSSHTAPRGPGGTGSVGVAVAGPRARATSRPPRHGLAAEQAVEQARRRLARAAAGRRARAADPLGRERTPGRDPGHLPPHAERDQLTRRRLYEARHHRVARYAGERLQEAAAVRVRDQSVGPAREQQRVPRRARGAGRAIRGEHLRVEAAPYPAAVGESRLVVRRESLDRPARLILVGKQAGSPAEHV